LKSDRPIGGDRGTVPALALTICEQGVDGLFERRHATAPPQAADG
jgi:hypothetical protein